MAHQKMGPCGKLLFRGLKSQNFGKSYEINFKNQTILHTISKAFRNGSHTIVARAFSIWVEKVSSN